MTAAPVTSSPRQSAVIFNDQIEMGRALAPLCSALAGRTLLLTGASGMLPAYILHALAHLNHTTLSDDPCRVVALSRRRPTGVLAHEPTFEWLIQDVCDPLPTRLAFDLAIHAASPAAPRKYLAEPVGTLMANALGLHQILGRASACGAESVLYFSSGELYGSPPDEACPTPEAYLGTSDPRHPRGCYVEGKRFGEALAVAYGRQHGLPIKVVRPFQVFGPGLSLDDGRAFADFLSAGARGKDIVLLSAGRARRTYCYIADATVAFLKVLIEGEPGAVYNVGASSDEVSILDLARMVARLGGRGSNVVFDTHHNDASGKGSPARTCPSVEKIGRELGWKPTTGLEEGLARTLAWLRETGR